jgi:uncharacterized protein with LGFP repeats
VYVTAGGARVVPLVIRDAWAARNWERGPLGYPTSGAVAGAGGQGLVQSFQGGAVVATPSSGVRVLRGAVLSTWTAAGGSAGVLGWPTGDSTTAPDGVGSYGYFQGGAVYSSSSTARGYVLRGAVLDAWARTGWERGTLGYPTSETVAAGDGTRTDFERGWITVSGATGVATVHAG